MKKSTAIVIFSVLAVVAAMAAADLKLKTEYDRKNIQEYMVFVPLQPFHFIKDNFDTDNQPHPNPCIVQADNRYGVAVGFYNKDAYDYIVRNDTLTIQRKTGDAFGMINLGERFVVSSGALYGISSHGLDMKITGKMADHFSIHVSKFATARLVDVQTKELAVNAADYAGVSIRATDTLPALRLSLANESSFTANNTLIGSKTLVVGDSARLTLMGRSLRDFGVIRL